VASPTGGACGAVNCGSRVTFGSPLADPLGSRMRNCVAGQPCVLSTTASSAANSAAVGGRLSLSLLIA
jgi:hypothetical protein